MFTLTNKDLFTEQASGDDSIVITNDKTLPQGTEDFNKQNTDYDITDWSNVTKEEISRAFGIPQKDIFTDDAGKVTHLIDKDGEVISDDRFKEKLITETKPNTDPNQQNTDSGSSTNAATSTETKTDDEPFNLALAISEQFGLGFDHFEAEDGTKIPFADMDAKAQGEMARLMVNQIIAANSNPFQNDTEREFIEAMRSGKTPLDIARELVKNDGQYLANSLSDLDVFSRLSRKIDPSATDEDIKAEFDSLPEAIRNKKIASFRESLRTDDATNIALNRFKEEQNQQSQQEYVTVKAQFDQVLTEIAKTKVIDGLQLGDDILSDLKEYVTAPSAEANSKFIDSLSSPQETIRAAFWYRNIGAYQKMVSNQITNLTNQITDLKSKETIAFEKGKKAAQQASAQTKTTAAEVWKPTQQQQSVDLPEGAELM